MRPGAPGVMSRDAWNAEAQLVRDFGSEFGGGAGGVKRLPAVDAMIDVRLVNELYIRYDSDGLIWPVRVCDGGALTSGWISSITQKLVGGNKKRKKKKEKKIKKYKKKKKKKKRGGVGGSVKHWMLSDIELECWRPVHLFSVIGPSGCGKSTLSGGSSRVWLEAKEGRGAHWRQSVREAAKHKLIGLCRRAAALLPWRTVRDNCHASGAGECRCKCATESFQKSSSACCARFGLRARTDAYPAQLCNRDAAACRNCSAPSRFDPAVLLIGRTFSALDEITREQQQHGLLDFGQANAHLGPSLLRPTAWAPATLTFVLVALLWQLVAILNPYILPSLEAVAVSFAADPGMYASNALVTLQEVLLGSVCGVLAGFLLAVLMCEFAVFERALMPLIVVVMVTPVVAIAPALVVAFGFGMVPKYIVTALVVFFPILVNSLAGLRGVDPRALEVLRTLHGNPLGNFSESCVLLAACLRCLRGCQH
ncbi:hypothetical protein FQR65_LT20617 [Abscondita terminalis]|nr:hypothetical protein FQR65_LT20617 [Abscondita terminalis]